MCARAVRGGPQIASAIEGIKAIDNHAHPVLTDPADREFDALPVDSMEPQSDPVVYRPGALKTPFTRQSKDTARQKYGDSYPAWVLDQIGVEMMLANRVAMGKSVMPPRFRWVAYADALIFPLDNAHLAAKNSDRKAFFALEDKLRARYLAEAGVSALPATLAEYIASVVTPTLERHKAGGALAEKFEAAYLRALVFDAAGEAQAERAYRAGTPPTRITRCSRITSSASWRRNAGVSAWRCICTRRRARADTSTWPGESAASGKPAE
jgi:hypothetical protein